MGHAPLHVAAQMEDMHTAALLLEEGAHLATTNKVKVLATCVVCCAVSTERMCCTLTASGRRREGVGDSYSCSTYVPRLYYFTLIAVIIKTESVCV